MTPPKRTPYPTLDSLNAQIAEMGELNPSQELQAQLCRALAERIDRAMTSNTGAQSMAIPGLIKQLNLSLDKLKDISPITDEFLEEIFGRPEKNAANAKRRILGEHEEEFRDD